MDKRHYVALGRDWLDDPMDPSRFLPLESVVRTLGHICRWNGRCDRFYSVLAHSLNLAALLPPDLKAQALVHDFAEAYTGDLPAPLKKAPEMRWYAEKEKRLEKRVWEHYLGVSEIDPLVMEKDAQLALIEAEQLGLGGEWTRNPPFISLRLDCVPDDFFAALLKVPAFCECGGEMGKWLSENKQQFPEPC